MALSDEARDILIASVLGVVVFGGSLLYLGGIGFQLPDAKTAISVVKVIVGGIIGLVLIALAILLAILAWKTQNWLGAIAAVFVLLLGVPLIGITVGFPEELKFLTSAAAAVVDLFNALLRAIGRAVS